MLSVEPYIWAAERDEENPPESLVQHIALLFADVCEHIAIPLTYQPEDIAVRFRELAMCWRSETRFLSSITEIVTNPSYQQIIGLGPPAIQLIMEELQKGDEHWFWALKAITGIDPVPPEDRGRVRRMAENWRQWGCEQGYLSANES